jgi:hypothetical protein
MMTRPESDAFPYPMGSPGFPFSDWFPAAKGTFNRFGFTENNPASCC